MVIEEERKEKEDKNTERKYNPHVKKRGINESFYEVEIVEDTLRTNLHYYTV